MSQYPTIALFCQLIPLDRRPQGPRDDLHQHDDAVRVDPAELHAGPRAQGQGHVRAVVLCPLARAAHPGQLTLE